MAADWGTFTHDAGEHDVVPPDLFELDEVISLQEAGVISDDIKELKRSPVKLGKAMAWVAIHRDRRDFTLDQAGRLTLADLNAVMTAYSDAVRRRQPKDHNPRQNPPSRPGPGQSRSGFWGCWWSLAC